MKERTYKQVESAKRRAEIAASNLMDDESRADEFADMSVEEYAELRGISIKNPENKERIMATKTPLAVQVRDLKAQLKEAQDRIDMLESERDDVLDALGLEVIDDDEDFDEEDEIEEDDEAA